MPQLSQPAFSRYIRCMSETAAAVLSAARRLGEEADGLPLPRRAHTVYNPLRYAWEPHAQYIKWYAETPARVLFLGMNPGPWGMAQTGVPFGEVNAVTEWLHISAPVLSPPREHPKRPIRGYACPRSEVSGRRLWGFFAERFAEPRDFFSQHFVANYCPLVFMEESGKNIPPDKMDKEYRRSLFELCDTHLQHLIEVLQPSFLIGIGKFAEARLRATVSSYFDPARADAVRIGSILHPSPANPQANRGWSARAASQLEALGIWPAASEHQ